MPAKIIQNNETPFRRVDVEPITLDIIENALRNARAEMDGARSSSWRASARTP